MDNEKKAATGRGDGDELECDFFVTDRIPITVMLRLQDLLNLGDPDMVLEAAKELRWWVNAINGFSPLEKEIKTVEIHKTSENTTFIISIIISILALTGAVVAVLLGLNYS